MEEKTAGRTSGMSRRKKILLISYMAVLTALSVGLIALLHFPIFPAVAFLEYDPGDIPILLSGYMLGMGPGLAITAVVCLIQAFLMGGNGVYGMLMHFIATGMLVTVSSLIYSKMKTRKGAALSLVSGAAAMTLIMIPANLIFTTMFMGVSADMVWGLMPFILAFNAIKAFGNSLVVFLIYKPLRHMLSRHDLTVR